MSPQHKFKLRSDLSQRSVIGTFVGIPHPVAVEITAAAGFDFLALDGEHAQLDRANVEELIRAADVARVPAMVRVPGLQSEYIASALDAGAAGVLVPRVSTAAQARAAVAATRFPPVGERGAGPGRASLYGAGMQDYIRQANDGLLLAIQIETIEGVKNAVEISEIAGVDLIFIGPGDLSVSLAGHGVTGPARLDEAITQVIDACAKRNRAVGIWATDASRAKEWVARGVRLVLIAADTMFLQAGASGTVAAFRGTSSGAAKE